jgi:hypothetical protein
MISSDKRSRSATGLAVPRLCHEGCEHSPTAAHVRARGAGFCAGAPRESDDAYQANRAPDADAVEALVHHLGADLVGLCEAEAWIWCSYDEVESRPIEPHHRHAVVMLTDQGYEIWKPDVEKCGKYRLTNMKGSACGR